jgi:hypothetical protein
MIHSEVMTHRVFSRNAASSRAIPFKKMVDMIDEDPFIPIAWQKDHKGMQGTEYITDPKIVKFLNVEWINASHLALNQAEALNTAGLTKQLCNRLLEPYQWYTCLVTSTEFENFFNLRCPEYKLFSVGGGPARSRKDWLEKMKFSSGLHPTQYPKTDVEWWELSGSGAEIHIQALAESMWDAMNESTPKQLKEGEWHIPFGDKIDVDKLDGVLFEESKKVLSEKILVFDEWYDEQIIKVSTARCARLSYMTFDNEIDYGKDIKLHDVLLESGHMSPFEHTAQCQNDVNMYDNLWGWKSYRNKIKNK